MRQSRVAAGRRGRRSERLPGPPLASEQVSTPVEYNALLACAKAVVHPDRLPELEEALSHCKDPDQLVREALAQGMLGHLSHLCSLVRADPVLLARLRQTQRASAERSVRYTACLLRVLERLEQADIQAMPIKGPAWAEWLYGDVTRRVWTDLDLLVLHEQVAKARSVLCAQGLEDRSEFHSRLLSVKRGGWGQIALDFPEGDMSVELHWEVSAGFSPRPLTAERLLSRARPATLLGRPVIAPCEVDLLLILCMNGARDRWDRVEKLLSLAVAVRDLSPCMWPEVLAEARQIGCLRRLLVGVAFVCGQLSLSVPGPVAASLASDRVAQSLVRSLAGSYGGAEITKRPADHLVRMCWMFASEDTLGACLRHAGHRLLRPGPEDWTLLRLPQWAERLYYILRPFRLLKEWFWRLLKNRL